MLTRYKGLLKLKDWPSRSPGDQRCERREALWRVVSYGPLAKPFGNDRSLRALLPLPAHRRMTKIRLRDTPRYKGQTFPANRSAN